MLSLLSVISIFGTGIDVDYKLALAILIVAQVVIVLMVIMVVVTLLRRASKSIDEALERSEAKRKERRAARKAENERRDEEKRVAREEANAERERKKAEKEAQRLAKKEAKEEKKRAKEAEKAEKTKEVEEETVVVAVAAPVEVAAPAKEEPTAVARVLVGVSVNDGIVQREFTVGDEFNCDGLLLKAEYNMPPFQEVLADFTVVDADAFEKAIRNERSGVFVCRPDVSCAGKRAVRVCYDGKIAVYTISIVEKPLERAVVQPTPEPVVVERVVEKVVEVPVEKIVEKVVEVPAPPTQTRIVETVLINEESVEASRLRYDKSFEARFIQSDDDVKHWYTEIKNCLLSYKGCKGRISWKRETFKAKKEVVAKLVFRGNTLCIFLPLNPADFAENKEIEDGSNMPVYEDTPLMIRLKNEKRKRLAITLIERVMMERGVLHGAHQSEDFYVPYEGVVELINRGLIKREIKTVEDEAIFERDKTDED